MSRHALLIFVLVLTLLARAVNAQPGAVATPCPNPIASPDGPPFERWIVESVQIDAREAGTVLRCWYVPETTSAQQPYVGACLSFVTDGYGNLWVLVKEQLKPTGRLLCRYRWGGTTDPAPELRNAREPAARLGMMT